VAAPVRLCQMTTSWSAPPNWGNTAPCVTFSELGRAIQRRYCPPICAFQSKLKILKPLFNVQERIKQRITYSIKLNQFLKLALVCKTVDEGNEAPKTKRAEMPSIPTSEEYSLLCLMPCSSEKARRFEGAYCFHLHGRNPMSLHLSNQFHTHRMMS
jgi:hypothetical protein